MFSKIAYSSLLLVLMASCSGNSFSQTSTSPPTPLYDLPMPIGTSAFPGPKITRPPSFRIYCWNKDKIDERNPSEPPEPFLYLPFDGGLDSYGWTSQMDHDQPNYTKNGKIATLGEFLSFDLQKTNLKGGTISYPQKGGSSRWDPSDVSWTQIPSGYFAFSYQSPTYETYLSYDGHDGHDFGIAGNALAAADGIVVYAGNYKNSLGRVVEIFHPQGYLTRYAHLKSFGKDIKLETQVKAGDPVGEIGGSGFVNGAYDEDYWRIHLHFSVFRWNSERNEWEITDPFGWDPWAGPDWENNLQEQRNDPLYLCNGEVGYNLWFNGWPQSYDDKATTAFNPAQDRYVGGWLGDETDVSTPIPTPTQVSYELPPLNRQDYYSVLQWIKYAMANNDVSVFEELTDGDLIQLIDTVNAYATLKRPDFLSGLSERLPNKPQCEFYILSDKRLTVQTNSWSPEWEMKEFCHLDCSPMKTPLRNNSIVLSLELAGNGWSINTMGFNGDPSSDYPIMRLYPGGERISCDEVLLPTVSTPMPVPSSTRLNQSNLSSVLRLLTYAIDSRDLTVIEPLIGSSGTTVTGYATEYKKVGYDNSDEFIPLLSKALGNNGLVCLGYDNSPNYKAAIFFKGNVDWTQFPKRTNVDSNGIVFGLVKEKQKWELMYVTKLPSFVLSYSHDYDCSALGSTTSSAITSLAPLNRAEYFSVLQWIKYAALNNDISVFEELIVGNSIQLIDSGNAAVNIGKVDFLSELSTRLTSKPNCEFFIFEEAGRLVIQISNWSPGWGVNSSAVIYLILEMKNNQWVLTSVIYGDYLPSWAQGLERINYDTISLSAGNTTDAAACKEARPTRLKDGDFAFVSFYPPLDQRVRSSYGTTNSILDTIPLGTAVKIIDGPECADNWVWWKIKVLSSGLIGWTAEGDKDAYWLVPCESRNNCGTR